MKTTFTIYVNTLDEAEATARTTAAPFFGDRPFDVHIVSSHAREQTVTNQVLVWAVDCEAVGDVPLPHAGDA